MGLGGVDMRCGELGVPFTRRVCQPSLYKQLRVFAVGWVGTWGVLKRAGPQKLQHMHVPRPVQQIIRICMGERGAKHVRLGHPVCITLYTYLGCIQRGREGASCERLGRLSCITISIYLLVICGGGEGSVSSWATLSVLQFERICNVLAVAGRSQGM